MIEIFILIDLCKRLGVRARAKNVSPGWYQFLLVVSWFGAEFAWAVVCALVLEFGFGVDSNNYFFLIWLSSLCGAALSAWFVFKLVAIRPDPIVDDDDFDDDFSEDDSPSPRPPGNDERSDAIKR